MEKSSNGKLSANSADLPLKSKVAVGVKCLAPAKHIVVQWDKLLQFRATLNSIRVTRRANTQHLTGVNIKNHVKYVDKNTYYI